MERRRCSLEVKDWGSASYLGPRMGLGTVGAHQCCGRRCGSPAARGWQTPAVAADRSSPPAGWCRRTPPWPGKPRRSNYIEQQYQNAKEHLLGLPCVRRTLWRVMAVAAGPHGAHDARLHGHLVEYAQVRALRFRLSKMVNGCFEVDSTGAQVGTCLCRRQVTERVCSHARWHDQHHMACYLG